MVIDKTVDKLKSTYNNKIKKIKTTIFFLYI